MSIVEEIKSAIEKLSLEDRARLERMLHGGADDEWDRQMAADAAAGRFQSILADVDREIDEGRLRDMP